MKKSKIVVAVLLCVLALACIAFAGWLVYSTIINNVGSESQQEAEEAISAKEESAPAAEDKTAVPSSEEEPQAEPEEADGSEAEKTAAEPQSDEVQVPEATPALTAAQVDKQGVYSPVYCTVWPIKELSIYSSAAKTEVIGTAEACQMFTVISEDTDAKLFEVRIDPNSTGFIESNYCMINLTEYLGNLCSYDIYNSYDSKYMIHEYEIPGITGTVISGYENVRLADGTFLTPFLYVCTGKLINAASQALESGYRIRINDCYRPKIATASIYNHASSIIYNPLPDSTYTGATVSLPPVQNGDGIPQHSVLTYLDLVIYNGWQLSSFLAPGASMHNKGVALDLTFEDAETGEELFAQTSMHDLSSYSTIYSNNAVAKDIYKILTGCNLHNIVSEWWHFQDNSLPRGVSVPFCQEGVSAQGWIEDEQGVGYRLLDGTKLKNATLILEDVKYVFDENGCLVR